MSDEEMIWLSAVRYALGRRTYIVQVTTQYLVKQIPRMSDSCIAAIRTEISRAESLGDQCDIDSWGLLKQQLEEIK